jgi:hypothetical protein
MSATSVDDILIASDSKQESDHAATEINDKFTVTDGGDADWILGCRITRFRPKHLLMIDQHQYTVSILRQYKLDQCRSLPTPGPSKLLTTAMCPQTDEEREAMTQPPFNQYTGIVGKCMYLANCTRPDISYTVRELARFMSNYGKEHYAAAKRLLKYLQGTRSRGIVYGDITNPNAPPTFQAFADSDWAASENRKSISGYVIECGSGPIAWSSKQQLTVAASTCEAEYVSCAHCAQEIIWLRALLDELGFPQKHASPLLCDNKGTVACTHDPHSHSRMKHIDITEHFIRDCVNRGVIDVQHIPGTQNPADLLTKPLAKPTHEKWLNRIRLDIQQEVLEG